MGPTSRGGEARQLLAVLAARGIAVSEDIRARIDGCADPDQLNTWLTKAATASALSEVFD
ncbi:MAG: hypothetical protein KDB70_07235 [Mycobacterium sp.]|nr:hypothetical protein [Mycobacterium sp.]